MWVLETGWLSFRGMCKDLDGAPFAYVVGHLKVPGIRKLTALIFGMLQFALLVECE